VSTGGVKTEQSEREMGERMFRAGIGLEMITYISTQGWWPITSCQRATHSRQPSDWWRDGSAAGLYAPHISSLTPCEFQDPKQKGSVARREPSAQRQPRLRRMERKERQAEREKTKQVHVCLPLLMDDSHQ